MAGTVKTNEVKLVSPNGLVEKTVSMDNGGVVYIDGKEKANVVQEAWKSITPLNSWIPFGTGHEPMYMKDSIGFVHIKGALKNGATASGTNLFTLPTGYRPLTEKWFMVYNGIDNVPAKIVINANGEFWILGTTTNSSILVINSLYYMAEQ